MRLSAIALVRGEGGSAGAWERHGHDVLVREESRGHGGEGWQEVR